MGEKAKIAYVFGGAMLVVLVLLLVFGVRDTVLLAAWLAAFVAIPTQFSIANAAVTRKFAAVNNVPQDQR